MKAIAKGSLAGAVLVAVTTVFAAMSASAAWPERPVRFVVPWAPGGSTDIVARILALDLTKRLGQQVLVENRAGAGAIVGMQYTAQQPPDGATFLLTSTGYGFLINKGSNVDFVNSFASVAMIGFSDSALVVNPYLPINSVKDLIALAKKRPGELLYSSSGVGGFPHMNTELFKLMAGINLTHVPFKGGGPAVADTAAGHTQLQIGSIPTVIGQVRAKRLRAIAVGGPKPNPALPGLPTISESGVPGYESQIWFGVFAPKALPPAIITAMHGGIGGALDNADTVKRLNEQGVDINKMSTPAFAKLMASEQEKWAKVIKAANITGE
ncbi:MAG: tripartite tricarboxylate transporter substrate binding protein [Burkholderiales bacterium]|jgi:tripartite-type tricarboxylate transporter receptor subunit TctC|nr:tripartite tricarboxylate transporter substrate binding protein [Burkholderiales bacterium]